MLGTAVMMVQPRTQAFFAQISSRSLGENRGGYFQGCEIKSGQGRPGFEASKLELRDCSSSDLQALPASVGAQCKCYGG